MSTKIHFSPFLKFCGCVTIPYILINSMLVNRPKPALHAGGGLGLICQGNPE